MDELLLISVIVGALSGILALGIGVAAVHLFGRTYARDMDVDLYYRVMNDLKKRIDPESDSPASRSAVTPRAQLIWYALIVGFLMCFAVRTVLAFSQALGGAVPVVLAVWLVVTLLPLFAMMVRRAKQIVIVDIASVLERIAQEPDEEGAVWEIGCMKTVSGGDLFGEDQLDYLTLRICRTAVAPVELGLAGHVEVAEAGLQRTVRKSGLRQLRIRGWEVNELQDTQAEFAFRWSLHENTYAEIARCLARTVESLGFPLLKVRLGKVNPHEEENSVDKHRYTAGAPAYRGRVL